jgi:nitrite reductase (NADH) small subunit
MADPVGKSDPIRWRRVASLDEIPRLGARVVRLAEISIAIFRTSDDRVFALLDRCPHRGGPLSQGIVHGDCVTCPLHDWVIDLSSGEATGPDEGATGIFQVRVENGDVILDVSNLADSSAGYAEPRANVAGKTVSATLALRR